MALKDTVDFRGLAVADAYIRVGGFLFTSKTEVRGTAAVYASEAAAKSGTQQPLDSPVVDFTFDLADDAPNIYVQGYAAARLLYPESVDV